MSTPALAWLKTFFGGDGPPTRTPEVPGWRKWAAITLLVAVVGAAVGVTGLRVQQAFWPAPSGPAVALQQAADALVHAQRYGDRAAAHGLYAAAVSIMEPLNDLAPKPGTPLRHCLLAAQALTMGIVALDDGLRWTQQDQFEANMQPCRRARSPAG